MTQNQDEMTWRASVGQALRKLLSDKLFVVLVLIPTVLSGIYFGLLASNEYASVSQFVVRSPEKPTLTGLGVLLKNAGYNNASEEAYAADSYIATRDALKAINRDGAVARAYGAKTISILNRYDPFGQSSTFEQLFTYFQRKIKVDDNATTGITSLTVLAYRPEDAHKFNEELLELAENTVNRLNARARSDLIDVANKEVADASVKLQASAQALADYRNRNAVVDPAKQADVQLQMIAKLQDQLIASRAEAAELSKSAPGSESLPVLQARIASLSRQMADESSRLTGSQGSLAGQATAYQHLVVVNDLAVKQLAAAVGSLDQAMIEAQHKQSYVERIAQPSLPDYPAEPHRLRGILATLLVGLILWGIARMLVTSILEHVS